MTVRYYSSVAPPTTLSAGVGPGDTSIQVASTSGFPPLTPYTLSLSYDSIGEELVQVNNVGGTTLAVTRGIDGTSTTSHGAGATVRHVTSARDFSDSRNHENADGGVHGLAPGEDLVGTDKAQTLSNKTLNMATGTLNRVDIFNGVGWSTTISGDDGDPGASILSIRQSPSGQSLWKFNYLGQAVVVNTPANDSGGQNNYKFRITKNDATTDVMWITAGGSIRTILANSVPGVTVQGSPDNVQRDAFRVIDLNGSTTRAALRTDGTALIASKAAAQVTMDIRGAASQSTSILKVSSSAGTQYLDVDGTGNVNVANGLNVGTVNGRNYPRIASGQVTFNFSGSTQEDVNVTFPAGLFSSTPRVTVTLSSLPGTSSSLIVRSNGTTTSGTTLRCNDTGGTSRTLSITADWIAVQT